MTNKQANILFIPTSISGNSAEHQDALSQREYYRQLICASLARGKYTIDLSGQRLAAVARHAYFSKQMDAVEQVSQLMLALPLSDELESVAQYYQALCTWRRGDRDGARRSLERVLEVSPQQYRARALQIIGLTYHECGEVDAALPFYLAAGKAASDCDPATVATSLQMTAVVRSIHGDHKHALADLEKIFPAFREVGKYNPALYYEFLNSLAVELGEVGRIAEAEAACAIALASPFAAVNPNWAETRDEIAAKRLCATPSVVAVQRVLEHAASPLANPQCKSKPVGSLAFSRRASTRDSFQRSIIPIPVRTAILLDAVSTLDRVLACIGPRAPPFPQCHHTNI